jgi:hypothetical protein
MALVIVYAAFRMPYCIWNMGGLRAMQRVELHAGRSRDPHPSCSSRCRWQSRRCYRRTIHVPCSEFTIGGCSGKAQTVAGHVDLRDRDQSILERTALGHAHPIIMSIPVVVIFLLLLDHCWSA